VRENFSCWPKGKNTKNSVRLWLHKKTFSLATRNRLTRPLAGVQSALTVNG
jgi:hypothetical protein